MSFIFLFTQEFTWWIDDREMIDDLHKFKKAYRSAETDEIQSRLGGHSGWLKCMQAGLRADQGRAGWQGLTAERTLGQPGWELSWIFYKEHLSAELGWAWVETTGWDYFEKLSESEDWNPAESVEFFNLLEHLHLEFRSAGTFVIKFWITAKKLDQEF